MLGGYHMSQSESNNEAPILVEFSMAPGRRQVSMKPDKIVDQSRKAIEKALSSIHNMADRVAATIESLAKPPSEVEVSFGIKFDAESGAIIAKAGIEASVNVTLKWQKGQ
jgi:hypothetical protein